MNVYYRKSTALVLILIEATYIVTGDRGQPCVTSCFQCEQQNPWWWPANEASNFVCMCLRTQSTMELSQNNTKSMARRRWIQAVYTWEDYLCRNLGDEEGGGYLLKGGVFGNLRYKTWGRNLASNPATDMVEHSNCQGTLVRHKLGNGDIMSVECDSRRFWPFNKKGNAIVLATLWLVITISYYSLAQTFSHSALPKFDHLLSCSRVIKRCTIITEAIVTKLSQQKKTKNKNKQKNKNKMKQHRIKSH